MRYRMARLDVNVGGDCRRRARVSARRDAQRAAWRRRLAAARAPRRLAELRAAARRHGDRAGRRCIRSACRRASTAATRSSGCSPTGSTGTRIRTSRRIRGLQVSAHFLVRRDGELLQFVSCDERAWHAGASSLARPRATATISRSASSSKGWKARPSRRRSTTRCAALLRSARAALSDRARRRPRARRAGPQERSRRGLRLGRACAACAVAKLASRA